MDVLLRLVGYHGERGVSLERLAEAVAHLKAANGD